jgi:hypothetical protein
MEYQKFMDKQKEIYDKFNGETLVNGGTKPSSIVTNGVKEYLIVLKHCPKISDEIARFSERINKEIPSVAYESDNIHTTITNYNTGYPKGIPEERILEKLVSPVKKAIKDLEGQPFIAFGEWGFNDNTVIVKGQPSKEFFTLSKAVTDYSKAVTDYVLEDGMDLRLPWGGHITATRFTKEMSPEELGGFLMLMREAPSIGNSTPEAVHVGWCDLDKYRFKLNIEESFPLK